MISVHYFITLLNQGRLECHGSAPFFKRESLKNRLEGF